MTTLTLRRRALPRVARTDPGLGPVGWTAIGVIALLALIAVLAPWLAPHDPNNISLLDANLGSSGDHLLGTDASGRDLLSRLLVGARSSLIGPLLVVVLATALGLTVAIVSAWLGGWVDAVVSRILDILFAFPGVLLAVLVVAVFRAGLGAAVAALVIAYIPYIARTVRSAALREKSQPYITALTIQGVGAPAICVRHILANLMPLIVAQSTLTFGYAMVDLAAVSFLGLGVQPPTADWGVMVSTGQPSILNGYPQESLYASALIVLAVGAFNILGDRFTERSQRSTR
ncbi:ABC transporter permease [Streptomyces atratus]|uniref:ABC transporter permease n=1 Tax=Streptomyces atratus TaxID=1893 RepID=UPI0019C146FE|nr:ABC transporter permease [Streptomyces atratus]WPW26307.1 ABC transporter permease [Streptomyces atratus]GGT65826.1 dipeptide ABC transporter permease DppC [Streptomyces atratus]